MLGLDVRYGFGGTVAKRTTDTGYAQQLVYARRADGRSSRAGAPSVCAGRFVPQVPVSFTPPDIGRGYPTAQPQGVAGFGGIFDRHYHYACPELDGIIDGLQAQMPRANTNSPAYAAAQTFVDRYTGLFGGTVVVGAESCKNVVAQGRLLLESLGGGALAPNVSIDSGGATGSILDALGSLKWIVIGGAVIAGVYLVAPWVRR